MLTLDYYWNRLIFKAEILVLYWKWKYNIEREEDKKNNKIKKPRIKRKKGGFWKSIQSLLWFYQHSQNMTGLTAQEKEEEQEDSISLTTQPSPSLLHPQTTSRHEMDFPRIFGSTQAPGTHGKNTTKVELVSGASRCHTIKNWLRQALLRRI